VADARALDLPDGCVDAVLLLGPLYHLPRRADRLRALREARRIARPGAPLCVAAISRWSPRLDAVLLKEIDFRTPEALSAVVQVERTGVLPPLGPGDFTGFCHRPHQFRAELRASGLVVRSIVAVEGVAFLLPDLTRRLDDPRARSALFASLRATEEVPELLGASPHLLATAVAGDA
jgi:SAM-dependent methyltransferase